MSYRVQMEKKDSYEKFEFVFSNISDATSFMRVAFCKADCELLFLIEKEKEDPEKCADTAEE